MYKRNLTELIERSNHSYPRVFLADGSTASPIFGERAVYVLTNRRKIEFPYEALREALERSLIDIRARVPTHGYTDEGEVVPLDVIVDNGNETPIRVRVPRRCYG